MESILITHKSIDDAAVIGVYSEHEATEYPVAYIKLKHKIIKSDKLKREIRNFVERKVASYKKLRGGILFTDKIPKSPSGKILRKKIKK